MEDKKKYQLAGKDIEESSLSQARFNAPEYKPSNKAQEVIKNTWSRFCELRNLRDGNYKCEPKSHGLGEELADARIRLADLVVHIFPEKGSFDKEVVEKKIEYNEGREYKHGRGL